MPVLLVPVHPLAKLPVYKTEESSGADLYAVEDFVLMPIAQWTGVGKSTRVRTGLELATMDPGFELVIRPRSGVSDNGIVIINSPGSIDSDYRGEIMVLMASLWDEHHFKAGDRIAQMVYQRKYKAEYLFATRDQVEATARGAGGFGSTGR